MRKILCASALVWALCCPTFAGDIQAPPVVPPQTVMTQEQDADSIIHGDNTNSINEIALDLFAVIRSLF
jgi:hypothetical protein